uniref:Thioredoxin domain-containing protein n=1 Tax=Hanusia phi TaxID=3032 RepID=A0A7S0EV19_9CRYP
MSVRLSSCMAPCGRSRRDAAGPLIRPLLSLRGGGKRDVHKWLNELENRKDFPQLFAGKNAMLPENALDSAIQYNLMKAASAMEQQVDEKIKHLDELDSDEIERLRDKRVKRLKKIRYLQNKWRAMGTGEYREVSERDLFSMFRHHKRIIIHFHRESTERCKLLDKHLATLAAEHVETLFVKIDVEKSHFLVQKLNVKVLPCMKLIKDEQVFKTLIGFEAFGNRDDFKTRELAMCLARYEMIRHPDMSLDEFDVGDEDVLLSSE